MGARPWRTHLPRSPARSSAAGTDRGSRDRQRGMDPRRHQVAGLEGHVGSGTKKPHELHTPRGMPTAPTMAPLVSRLKSPLDRVRELTLKRQALEAEHQQRPQGNTGSVSCCGDSSRSRSRSRSRSSDRGRNGRRHDIKPRRIPAIQWRGHRG